MTIDYNLAKQLKDAGFPSEYKNYECKECGKPCEDSEVGTPCSCGWNGKVPIDIVFRAPTLEELIEACGETYKGYEFMLSYSIDQWFCNYFNDNFKKISNFPNGIGKTPTEAVANLYLELHKSKEKQ